MGLFGALKGAIGLGGNKPKSVSQAPMSQAPIGPSQNIMSQMTPSAPMQDMSQMNNQMSSPQPMNESAPNEMAKPNVQPESYSAPNMMGSSQPANLMPQPVTPQLSPMNQMSQMGQSMGQSAPNIMGKSNPFNQMKMNQMTPLSGQPGGMNRMGPSQNNFQRMMQQMMQKRNNRMNMQSNPNQAIMG